MVPEYLSRLTFCQFPLLFTFQAYLNILGSHFSSNICLHPGPKNTFVPCLGLADSYGSSTFPLKCCFWNVFPESFTPAPQRQVQVLVLHAPTVPCTVFSQILPFKCLCHLHLFSSTLFSDAAFSSQYSTRCRTSAQ